MLRIACARWIGARKLNLALHDYMKMKKTVPPASHTSQPPSRLLPFTLSRVGKLAACLLLGLATLSPSARSQGSWLVGRWLAGATNFNDISAYAPTNSHDSYTSGAGTCGELGYPNL